MSTWKMRMDIVTVASPSATFVVDETKIGQHSSYSFFSIFNSRFKSLDSKEESMQRRGGSSGQFEKFLLVTIFKMAATIPHKFNIVRFQRNFICR